MHLYRRTVQGPIKCPQSAILNQRRGKQVHVDPAKSFSKKPTFRRKQEHFVVLRERRIRKCFKQAEYLIAIMQIAACQLSDNEVVAQRSAVVEHLPQVLAIMPKVIYPD